VSGLRTLKPKKTFLKTKKPKNFFENFSIPQLNMLSLDRCHLFEPLIMDTFRTLTFSCPGVSNLNPNPTLIITPNCNINT